MPQDVPAALLARSGTESTTRPGKLPPPRRFTARFALWHPEWMLKKLGLVVVKVIRWILQICLKNWENEESKQQASPDTKPSAFPGDANANTIVPKSESRWFPSACPHHRNTTKQKAIVLIQKQPILFKTNAFPAIFLWKIPSPTSNRCAKVGRQAGVGFGFECPKEKGKQQQSRAPLPAPAGLSGAAVINQNQLWEM